MRQRRCFCNYRRVGIKGVISANYLAGLGRVQTQLAGHAIDAMRVAELRFGKTQLAVLFLKQVALLLPGGAVHKILVMDYLQPDETAADQADPANKEEGYMQQAKAAMDGPCLYRAGSRSTRPLYRWLRAGWLAKKRELLHPDPPLLETLSYPRIQGVILGVRCTLGG